MTSSSEAVNGTAPPPAEGDQTTIGERLMGVIGIAFAAGLLLIGLDLMTGGAVARALTRTAGGEPDAGSGG